MRLHSKRMIFTAKTPSTPRKANTAIFNLSPRSLRGARSACGLQPANSGGPARITPKREADAGPPEFHPRSWHMMNSILGIGRVDSRDHRALGVLGVLAVSRFQPYRTRLGISPIRLRLHHPSAKLQTCPHRGHHLWVSAVACARGRRPCLRSRRGSSGNCRG